MLGPPFRCVRFVVNDTGTDGGRLNHSLLLRHPLFSVCLSVLGALSFYCAPLSVTNPSGAAPRPFLSFTDVQDLRRFLTVWDPLGEIIGDTAITDKAAVSSAAITGAREPIITLVRLYSGRSAYRFTWVDPPSCFLGLIPLLLKVGAMHGTHYETTNPSLVCTHPTSSGQMSNLAVFASVRSSRALAGWASAAAGAGQARQPGRARRIGRRSTKRSSAALRATQPHFDDQIETRVSGVPPHSSRRVNPSKPPSFEGPQDDVMRRDGEARG
jgi:hypothetical protein